MNFPSSFISSDRVWLHSALLALCFCGVLLLASQSAASLATYCLALSMVLSFSAWRDVFRCPMIWPVTAVLAYFVLTAIWSDNFTVRSFVSALSRGLLTFCFVVAVGECQLRGLLHKWLTQLLGFIGAGVGLVCIALFFSDRPDDGRLNGLGQLDTQVVAALVFGFTLILLLHSALQDRANANMLWWRWCAIVILGTVVLLTGSRNALVSVSYGAVLLVLSHRMSSASRFTFVALGIAFAAVAMVGLAWFNTELREMWFPRGDSFRMIIWSETLSRIISSPYFGLGILSSDDIHIEGLTFHHPHNLYLSATAQGGVVGLALLLWLLGRALRELLRSYSETDAKLALGILGMALPAYLLDGHELLDKIGDTWFLIWFPVAIALGLRWHATYR